MNQIMEVIEDGDIMQISGGANKGTNLDRFRIKYGDSRIVLGDKESTIKQWMGHSGSKSRLQDSEVTMREKIVRVEPDKGKELVRMMK